MVAPTDILIRHLGERGVTPYETLSKAADTSNCIHVAFVAEGYTKDEMNIFLKDARAAEDAIFSYEPFKSLKDRFNIVAVGKRFRKRAAPASQAMEYGDVLPWAAISTLSIRTVI
jgi:hypothetical protein